MLQRRDGSRFRDGSAKQHQHQSVAKSQCDDSILTQVLLSKKSPALYDSLLPIALENLKGRQQPSLDSSSQSALLNPTDSCGEYLTSWSTSLRIILRLLSYLTFAEVSSLAHLSSTFAWATLLLSIHSPFRLQTALCFGGYAARSQQAYLSRMMKNPRQLSSDLSPSCVSLMSVPSSSTFFQDTAPSHPPLSRVALGTVEESLASTIFKSRKKTALEGYDFTEHFGDLGDYQIENTNSEEEEDEEKGEGGEQVNEDGTAEYKVDVRDGSGLSSSNGSRQPKKLSIKMKNDIKDGIMKRETTTLRGRCWMRLLGIDGYVPVIMTILKALDEPSLDKLLWGKSWLSTTIKKDLVSLETGKEDGDDIETKSDSVNGDEGRNEGSLMSGPSTTKRRTHHRNTLRQLQKRIFKWFALRIPDVPSPFSASSSLDSNSNPLSSSSSLPTSTSYTSSTSSSSQPPNGLSAHPPLLEKSVVEAILKDVPRTLLHRQPYVLAALDSCQSPQRTTLPSTQETQPQSRSLPLKQIIKEAERIADLDLKEVLCIYAMLDSRLSYCQGMNFIAGLLLSQMDKYDALWAFAAIMNGESLRVMHKALDIIEKSSTDPNTDDVGVTGATNHGNQPVGLSQLLPMSSSSSTSSSSSASSSPLPLTRLDELSPLLFASPIAVRHSFLHNLAGARMLRFQLLYLLRSILPRTYHHLQLLAFPIDLLSEWYMTLFASPSIPSITTLRLWDYLLSVGTPGILSLSIALFSRVEERLLTQTFEGVYAILKQSSSKSADDQSYLEPEILVNTAALLVIPEEMVSRLITVGLNNGVIS